MQITKLKEVKERNMINYITTTLLFSYHTSAYSENVKVFELKINFQKDKQEKMLFKALLCFCFLHVMVSAKKQGWYFWFFIFSCNILQDFAKKACMFSSTMGDWVCCAVFRRVLVSLHADQNCFDLRNGKFFYNK